MQLRNLLFALFLFLLFSPAKAQNTTPYWSLSGNSGTTATATSKLGTTGAIPLNLVTNNLTRAYIASDGKIGIGTVTPQQRFHVEGADNQAIFVSTTAPGSFSGSGTLGYLKALPTAKGQRLGYVLFGSRGGGENAYNPVGLAGFAAGPWTVGSSYPTYLIFETTPVGSITRRERMRITADGSVGIGTNVPHASSIFDLTTATKGMLTPRMTMAQRDAIASPARGLFLFQTDNKPGFYYYDGGWKGLAGTGESANRSLSNLAGSTAVNTDLTPEEDDAVNVGSSNYHWKDGYFSGTMWGVNANFEGLVNLGPGGEYGSTTQIGGSTVAIRANAGGEDVGTAVIGVNSSLENRGTKYGYLGSQNAGVYGYGGSTGGTGMAAFSEDLYNYEEAGDAYSAYGALATSDASVGVYGSTTRGENGWGGYFEGRVYAGGGLFEASDQVLKENINDLHSAMTIIQALKPKQYTYRHDGAYRKMMLPKGNRFGLLAQDVEKVVPEVVGQSNFKRITVPKLDSSVVYNRTADNKRAAATANSNKLVVESVGFKTISYTQLIPVLIKAMQEQQTQIETQKLQMEEKDKKMEALESRLTKLEALLTNNNKTSMNASAAYLEQASPNPVQSTTIIRYSIPNGTTSARLTVTNVKGQVLKEMNLSSRGTGQVNLNTSSLASGVYSYILWVDGHQADSKQLVVAR